MNLKYFLPLIFIGIIQCVSPNKKANLWFNKIKKFDLPKRPIDVVICCHEKDKKVLLLCIKGVKDFVENVRRIIVISEKPFTNEAEWFDESLFPFSKKSIGKEFSLIDPSFSTHTKKVNRCGWYFKQLMNFYSAFIVPNISTNILILDADTIFLKPVAFVDDKERMLHAPGTENYSAYFEHMNKLLPGLKRVVPKYSGISHHMLFQVPILKDLFKLVENHHKTEFWKAYCKCVDPKEIALSGSADYEIYFNFVLMRTKQIKIRPLKWKNISKISLLDDYKKGNYDFVSWHSYIRVDDLD